MKLSTLEQERYARGWSREELAERVAVNPCTIQRWERGLSKPHGYNLRRLCDVFGMTPEALGLQLAGPCTDHFTNAFSPQSSGVQNDEICASAERQKHIHTLEAGIDFMKESRRRLLRRMLNLAEGMVVAPHILSEITPLEQLTEVLASPVNVNNTTLANLEMITRNHWYLFLHTPSKSDLLSSCWGHLQTLLQFLQYTQPGAVRNQLYSLAGESAVTIGEILFDIQDYHHAQIYYQFSIHAAKEAGNNPLRAVGLGRLSFLPIYQSEPRRACPLLEEAEQVLTYSPRPKIRSWLAAIKAETMAHLEERVACEKALEQAETFYDQEGSEEDMLWTQLNAATIPGYKGACYLRLQQGEKALLALKETLPSVPDYSPRHQSLILADMAAAMAQMNEVEECCKLFHSALKLTQQTKSLIVLTRLQNVHTHLLRRKDTSSVKMLDQSIEEMLPAILS